MFVCVGPASSGKTTLLNRLRNSNDCDVHSCSEMPIALPIPTIGTSLISIPNKRTKKKHSDITIRELGGLMAPIWQSYFIGIKGMMFVVDAGSSCQVAAATMLFLRTLRHQNVWGVHVLFVFNKVDSCTSTNNVKGLMRLDDIMASYSGDIVVVETSALNGIGIHTVKQWIDTVCNQSEE